MDTCNALPKLYLDDAEDYNTIGNQQLNVSSQLSVTHGAAPQFNTLRKVGMNSKSSLDLKPAKSNRKRPARHTQYQDKVKLNNLKHLSSGQSQTPAYREKLQEIFEKQFTIKKKRDDSSDSRKNSLNSLVVADGQRNKARKQS
jgi:hypothetical protein